MDFSAKTSQPNISLSNGSNFFKKDSSFSILIVLSFSKITGFVPSFILSYSLILSGITICPLDDTTIVSIIISIIRLNLFK